MTIQEKLNYLFSKINWGASALDAEAIQIMNNIKKDIDAEMKATYELGRKDKAKEIHFQMQE
jgi:hypothetical protein